jgi:hypothetical protein
MNDGLSGSSYTRSIKIWFFFLILNFLFKINLLIFLNYIDVKNNFFKIKNYFNIL